MQINVINIEKVSNYKHLGKRWAYKSPLTIDKTTEDKNIKNELEKCLYCIYRITKVGKLIGKQRSKIQVKNHWRKKCLNR
jgi:hypothetical protein